MMYSRGDVVLSLFPNSDMTSYKKCPVLIVQSDDVERGGDQKLVALITSNLKRTGVTRVPIDCNSDLGRSMGLMMDSVVMTDNLATIKEHAFIKKIGHCSDMTAIDAALSNSLGILAIKNN
ncbi:MAG: type II toxin-antitoxin system PemK/MazF family toxin [Alkalinema sp. CAN_BIN05]|nr:type II toxin-antitoxin system PemK/MazF family toxin [Alkalinema sp. CAN_BIN05]